MIIITLVLTMVGWLFIGMVFESGYQVLKASPGNRLQKHQWCWIFWTALGVLLFAIAGASYLIHVAMTFCIASAHIKLCGMKEDLISPVEIVKNIPSALREVYERFRRILTDRTGCP